MIKILHKKHYKIEGGTKYFIDCDNISPKSFTLENIIKNKNSISILHAILDYTKHTKKNKHIVIKIAHKSKTNLKEYEISKKLQNINGFIKYICLFKCYDDTYKFIINNNKLPDNICSATNLEENDNIILISPYIKYGSIRDYKWNITNTNILHLLTFTPFNI